MKKIHLIAASAAIIMASCSNDELVKAPEAAPIGFDSYIGKVTRADDATLANVNAISVYGYIGDAGTPKIFDGTIVSKTSGDWTYTPLQYWTAGKNYFFTALASQVSAGNSHYGYTWATDLTTETAGFNGNGTVSFENTQDKASGNEDLLYASATATTPAEITTAPSRVQFAFRHALSRVKFSFKNGMGSDSYSIKIHDVKINNTAATGTLALGTANPVWEASGSAVLTLRPNYFIPANAIAGNTGVVASGTKFIIPETKALSVSFEVDLIVNGTTIETYSHSERILPQVEFKNGYSYNFVAEINAQNIDPSQELYPILFSVQSIDEWTDAPVTDVNLNTEP